MKTLFEDRDTFFNSSNDVKAASKAPDLTNMGYILIPKIREYIKVNDWNLHIDFEICFLVETI